ncbi:MAG: class I SAM-dependent methyltransferase [Promethearchaeota archaeon]
MKCYLCGSEELKIVREKVRYNIPRKVLECQNCGLNYLKPTSEDLEDYYAADYRKNYKPILGEPLKCKEMFELLLPYQMARVEEIKHLLHPEIKILDVGCSTGHFLYTIKEYVKECVGIEYNQKDADFTQNELGIKTYSTSIEKTGLPLAYYDMITLYQVLEHFEDPIKSLKIYKKYLRDDGYLVVEVPNIQDILISGYKIDNYLDFWFREPHLFNFSPKTLTMVMEKAGFKGNIKGFQCYNLMNHFNWIFLKKPQKSIEMGWSEPILIKDEGLDSQIKKEINIWFTNVNKEYQKLLEKHLISESILFIGQKE